jgi:hypothetical protein
MRQRCSSDSGEAKLSKSLRIQKSEVGRQAPWSSPVTRRPPGVNSTAAIIKKEERATGLLTQNPKTQVSYLQHYFIMLSYLR